MIISTDKDENYDDGDDVEMVEVTPEELANIMVSAYPQILEMDKNLDALELGLKTIRKIVESEKDDPLMTDFELITFGTGVVALGAQMLEVLSFIKPIIAKSILGDLDKS